MSSTVHNAQLVELLHPSLHGLHCVAQKEHLQHVCSAPLVAYPTDTCHMLEPAQEHAELDDSHVLLMLSCCCCHSHSCHSCCCCCSCVAPEQSRRPGLRQTLACNGPSWCQQPSAVVALQYSCSVHAAAQVLATARWPPLGGDSKYRC
jgi:hypothetical protein